MMKLIRWALHIPASNGIQFIRAIRFIVYEKALCLYAFFFY
jgi:hypothetical protein